MAGCLVEADPSQNDDTNVNEHAFISTTTIHCKADESKLLVVVTLDLADKNIIKLAKLMPRVDLSRRPKGLL